MFDGDRWNLRWYFYRNGNTLLSIARSTIPNPEIGKKGASPFSNYWGQRDGAKTNTYPDRTIYYPLSGSLTKMRPALRKQIILLYFVVFSSIIRYVCTDFPLKKKREDSLFFCIGSFLWGLVQIVQNCLPVSTDVETKKTEKIFSVCDKSGQEILICPKNSDFYQDRDDDSRRKSSLLPHAIKRNWGSKQNWPLSSSRTRLGPCSRFRMEIYQTFAGEKLA